MTPQTAQEAGAATIDTGLFVSALISLLIVSFAVSLLVRYQQASEAEHRPYPSENGGKVPTLHFGPGHSGYPLPALHIRDSARNRLWRF